ncbi:MAG: hypothetical protein SFX73_09870 [Kofleriaceae bacterium]|nr:hypothetical protein [Kofleriaceae bacterium]
MRSLVVVALLAGEAAADARMLRTELFFGAHAEGYSTLDEDGDAIGGVHAAAALSLPARLAVQLDVLGASFTNGDPIFAAAGRVYYRDARFALGALGGWTGILDQAHGVTLGGFVERYEGDLLLASVSAGVERKDRGEDLVFGEVMLHLYPARSVLLLTGFSYAQAEIKQTRADIVLHAEWAPWTFGGVTLAGYVQYGGNLLTRGSLGLVLYFDTDSYARRERTRGVYGLRFK